MDRPPPSWTRFARSSFATPDSVFDALDEQSTLRILDLVAGDGQTGFGEEMAWVAPRSIALGPRLSFGR